MMRRGSLPRMALIWAGLSSLTRSGPETGMGEGSVIASAGISNVRSGRIRRGAILAMAVVPLLLIAIWVRTPALPRTAGTASQNGVERVGASDGAMRALARALDEARQRLEERATNALNAPSPPADAFDFLSKRSPQRE